MKTFGEEQKDQKIRKGGYRNRVSPSDLPDLSVHSLLSIVVLLAGCRTEQTFVMPDPHLNRMLEQDKVLAYDLNEVLPAGMAMQHPPDGTMPVGTLAGEPLVVDGVADDRYAEHVPIPIDRALVDVGRERFDTFCAACHGLLGDGVSMVADKMALRKPPDLHEARIVGYPPGRIYRTIRQGYGLMPSYAVQIPIREAWGVTAYVRALQLARHVAVATLPPPLQAEIASRAR
jgi:mono/diheme cytochrome c family protein